KEQALCSGYWLCVVCRLSWIRPNKAHLLLYPLQSYEIGKMDKKYSTGQEMQAKVLRLLATAYLEWDCTQCQDKALRAISLANECFLLPSPAVAELLHHEVSLDVCLNTAKLLLEQERESVGFEFLKSVAGRLETSPDVGKVILLHIELLLQRAKEPLAKQMMEDVITGHYKGKQLSPETLTRLHILLWDRAAKSYEVWNPLALQWYNYSLSFYSPGQIDQNLAKLQRNMASCYLHLKQLEKAKEAVKGAERCDPSSIFTQFSVYKIAILEGNADKAVEAICSMGELATKPTHHEDKLLVHESTATNLLSLAAQIALENEQQFVAIKALEYLSQHSQDCQQVFTGLAGRPFTEEGEALERRTCDAHWFRKIAWNLAVQCKSCPEAMRDFFVLSFKVCTTSSSLSGSVILTHASYRKVLEACRSALCPSPHTHALARALHHIQACREIWKVLKLTGDFTKDPTETLLLLYEFEARAKLNDPALDNMLELVWELPQVEIKTLETIASLAMECPAHYPSVCRKALKSALILHRKQEALDTGRFSKCLHSLVHLSLPASITDTDACVLEEAWGYFEDALSVLGSTVN
uniref:Protein ZIP4 homolog n=1 Tax=Sphenodon punctatus TaxID=8508 RepID=A0A8D0G493_SPHPU